MPLQLHTAQHAAEAAEALGEQARGELAHVEVALADQQAAAAWHAEALRQAEEERASLQHRCAELEAEVCVPAAGRLAGRASEGCRVVA